jgi:hypothetical protein
MKILFFLLVVFISKEGLACSCGAKSPLIEVATSEFVAKVKILNVTQDIDNSYYNDVEIEILDLYKGDEISLLKNYGGSGSMCGITTPIDTTWLIYAYRHIDGFLRYDLCTGSK